MRKKIGLLASAAVLALTGCAVVPPPGVIATPVPSTSAPNTPVPSTPVATATASTISTASPSPSATTVTPDPTVTPDTNGEVTVQFEVEAPKGTVADFTDGLGVYSNRQDTDGIVAWQIEVPKDYVVALYISPTSSPTRCSIKIDGQKVAETKVKGNYQAPTICDAVAPLPKVKSTDIDPETGKQYPHLSLTATSNFGWVAWSSSVTAGEDFSENGVPLSVHVAGRSGDTVRVVVLAVLEEKSSCSVTVGYGHVLASAKTDKQHPLILCTATIPTEG